MALAFCKPTSFNLKQHRDLTAYKNSFVVRAQNTDTPSPSTPTRSPRSPTPQRPSVLLGPDGQPLEVIPVQKTGEDAWAGVAAVDRGDDQSSNLSKVGLLVAGDAAALLLFAAIGRINHGGVLDAETLFTALPFMLGWFITAPFLGAYGKAAQGSDVPGAAVTAAKGWAAGVPIGLVLRGISKGYAPPTPFIVVTLVSTAVLLVGWRSALAANTKEEVPLSPAAKLASRQNKQGNPFEFMQLLASLVKRW